MKKYTLTINEKQLDILNRATHSLMRQLVGQLKYALGDITWDDKSLEKLNDKQRELLKTLDSDYDYNQMFGHTEDSELAYDLHQVLRHQQWLENFDRNEHVVSSHVTQFGKTELAKLEVVK